LTTPAGASATRAGTGRGKRIGIGIGTTLDSGTNNFGQARIINPNLPFSGNGEAAYVKLDLYGEVNVNLGTTPQGQSHETTAAQVVATSSACRRTRQRVRWLRRPPQHYVAFSGTYASQFAVTDSVPRWRSGEAAGGDHQGRGLRTGGEEEEIELNDGSAYVPRRRGARDSVHRHRQPRVLQRRRPGARDRRLGQLNCRHVYRPPFEIPDTETKTGNLTLTYASQTHACVLELDEDTGAVEILDYAVADDCGRVINPSIVTARSTGNRHGIGAALWETFEYDEDGQLQQSSFYDYHAVTALDVPHIKTSHLESPSPFTPTARRAWGEGGGAPLHAICSALQDALGEGAPVVAESHNHWERIYRLLHPESGALRAWRCGRGERRRQCDDVERRRVILSHEFTVDGDLETVWSTLLDLERVAGCLPGATIRAPDENGRFEGSMKVKMGPMTVTYDGAASLVEVDNAEHRAVISLRAREAKGQAPRSR